MNKIKYNEQQQKVVDFKKGNCCVIAGAGSGKSTTLIGRVEKLIEDGTPLEEIMMITFTNNSAKDLKGKLFARHIDGVRVGTFHSVCARILGEEIAGFSTRKLIQQYMIENCFRKIDKKINIEEMLRAINYQKANMININDRYILKDFPDYTRGEVKKFYQAYEDLKKEKGLYDFSDWLSMAMNVLEQDLTDKHTVKYLLIDESQDCNLLNHKIAKLLCPSGNIMMVGDVRQSVYGFRAASPEIFMNFDKHYDNATILNIDNNYRSNKKIVEYANNFIKQYLGDFKYYSDSIAVNQEEGNIERIASIGKSDEAEQIVSKIESDLMNGIEPNRIAVLYRNNSQVDSIERELKFKEINYHIEKNDSFFERREIKLIICMLRLIQDPTDDSAYEYIYKKGAYPLMFMTNKTLQEIIDTSASRNISYYEASDIIRFAKPYERKNILRFKEIYNSLSLQHKMNEELSVIMNNIIKLFRINDYINNNYEDDELDDRLEGLISIRKFVRNNTLESFLKFVYTDNNKNKTKANSNEIQLMTIHKSKGLEFDNTYVIGIQNGKFPSDKASDIGEEARLMYVAVTRAKNNLVLSEIGIDNQFMEEYFG